MTIDKSKINRIIATDCGSTTTKAIMIERVDGHFRQTFRGEAPTTVEAPLEDVTHGVRNSLRELEELSGIKMLDDQGNIIKGNDPDRGVDLYVSTSSAGGGLQMIVSGVVKEMSGESAERAALGAGAIVMQTLAVNDGLLAHEKIERIRYLRPDMMLLAGGVDGGTVKHVLQITEIVAASNPKPRLGLNYSLPVIYAGNVEAQDEVKKILGEKVELDICENLRPSLEEENLDPPRQKIQTQFLEHVMSHAPGYPNLMKLTDVDIMPTPAAVGMIIRTVAKQEDMKVVGVDIGGATTDVFSVFKNYENGEDIFNRSVSANLGMSYSISNVFSEAGLENVMRWVPFDMDEIELRNTVKNKMIRPTSIPYRLEDLIFEQAIAREALRLSFDQHKSLAVGLKGVQKQRSIGDIFTQSESGSTLVNMMECGLVIGSGGVLSHAPLRNQTALMLIDSFFPEGFTRLAVDSIFMMPHLGVISEVFPEAANEVFQKDCLVFLGTCIAPVGNAKSEDSHVMSVTIKYTDGKTDSFNMKSGELIKKDLPSEETAIVTVKPSKHFNMGAGKGKTVEKEVKGGNAGLIFDTRGRPFTMSTDPITRINKLKTWYKNLEVYPDFKGA
ncbi:MAG: methylaspartate mutase [Candidatus Cloacimonadota bacterium]|nr:MAG: methylaspartate mutase [Candidatus Cloacimonadota bacterium]